jgi:hypothetical protein
MPAAAVLRAAHPRAAAAVHARAVAAAGDARVVVGAAGAGRAGVAMSTMTTGYGNRAKESIMSSFDAGLRLWRGIGLAAIAGVLSIAPGYGADKAPEGKQKPASQKTYAAPEDAVKDLMAAVKAGDQKALLAILGPEAKPLLSSGDKVADRESGERFLKAYEEGNKLEKSGDAKAVLNVGKDNWPFPIPVVKEASGWRFDTNAGREELLNRRVGRNELDTMQAVLAYVDAQRDYYLRNPQKGKLLAYAQKFVSAQGKRDGLYYPVKEGEPQSPLGPLFAAAKAEGYAKGEGGKPAAYHGYHFRILKAQGADAPGGAYDYVAQGSMIGGHALVAWPATYGNSGVMTFLVSHQGVVYEKDFGPGTAAAVQKITKFNPDSTWKKAEPVKTAEAPKQAPPAKAAEPAKAADPGKAAPKK